MVKSDMGYIGDGIPMSTLRWVPTAIVHSPILTEGVTWSFDNSRHLMRVATSVDRDAIFPGSI